MHSFVEMRPGRATPSVALALLLLASGMPLWSAADTYSLAPARGGGRPAVPAGGCTDTDGDGLCEDLDCDDTLPTCTTDCTDADGDGICLPADCDDDAFACAADCTDGDGDGVCDDSDNCPSTPNPNQGFVREVNGLIVGGGVKSDFVISPDGKRVLYVAHEDIEFPNGLYVAHTSGNGVQKKLSPEFTPGGNEQVDASKVIVSPDSSTVIYVKKYFDSGWKELYSVPIGGGASVLLDDAVSVSGSLRVSDDSDRVFYKANLMGASTLLSVPIDGGQPLPLSPLGTNVYNYEISPDGAWVVYRWGLPQELYSVQIAGPGGTPIRLDFPDVEAFQIGPDSSLVVYQAKPPVGGKWELFSVPIFGGTPVALNEPLAGGSNSGVYQFAVSPDSTVVYRAKQASTGKHEVFSVPIGGGTPVTLNAPLGSWGGVMSFALSPNGQTVVYHVDPQFSSGADGVWEIYSVPIGGGTPVKLNAPLAAGRDVSEFVVSPDSARVLYKADQEVDGQIDLYSVPIEGGTSIRLNDPLIENEVIWWIPGSGDQVLFTTDSGTVLYLQGADGHYDLYAVPIGGGTSIRLNGPLVAGGSVQETLVAVNPGGTTVVFRADQEVDQFYKLYRVSTTLDPAGVDTDRDGYGSACDCDDEAATCIEHCTDADADGLAACAGDCNDANPYCTDDCTDADGDGFCVTTDCNDNSAGSYLDPTEVTGLFFASDGQTLVWDSSASEAGPSAQYDVVRRLENHEFCLAPGILEPTATDTVLPAQHELFSYLVRVRNGCGVGTYGFQSDGAERTSSVCP